MKKIYIAALISFIIFCVAFFSPFLIKDYVEKHYPVQVSQVSFGWGKIYFNNVKYKTFAHFDEVAVPLWGPIIISGGTVELSPKLTAKSSPVNLATKKNIIANNINAIIRYNDSFASLNGISYSSKEKLVKFSTGFASIFGQEAELISGQFATDTQVLIIKYLNVSLKISKKAYNIGISNIFLMQDVSFSVKDMSFFIGVIDAGAIKVKKLLASTDKDGPFLSAETLEVTQDLFSKGPAEFKSVLLRPLGTDLSHFQISFDAGPVLTLDTASMSLSGAAGCNQWVDVLPSKPPALKSAKGSFDGNLSFSIKLVPPVKIDFKNDCKFKCSSSPIKDLYDVHGFKYTAYDKNNKPFERVANTNWVDFNNIAPELVSAITSLEDPAFYSHKGVLQFSLQLSLEDNIKTGMFRRGGSTLTMQLAKNLWLTRDKTLLRKANEIFLTIALESCLTKDQILEYYLNAVEFGPDVYGIGDATQYYFKKDPMALTKDEAYYLALLLPHPKKAFAPNEGGLSAAHLFAMNHVTNQTQDEE